MAPAFYFAGTFVPVLERKSTQPLREVRRPEASAAEPRKGHHSTNYAYRFEADKLALGRHGNPECNMEKNCYHQRRAATHQWSDENAQQLIREDSGESIGSVGYRMAAYTPKRALQPDHKSWRNMARILQGATNNVSKNGCFGLRVVREPLFLLCSPEPDEAT